MLPRTPSVLPGAAYLNRLVRKLVTRPRLVESGIEIDSEPLSITEENEIERAIASVFRLDKEYRRLGRVLDYLTKGQRSVHERLAKWCYSREAGRPDGANAWVFDNATDTHVAISASRSLASRSTPASIMFSGRLSGV